HPAAAADATAALAVRVNGGDPVVRGAAFAALGVVAEAAPHRATPVAGAAVAALDDPDDVVAAGAAQVVAGVADERPDAVREAVPTLAAGIESGRVPPAALVRGLDRIGAGYPAAVLPAVDVLLDHAESTGASGRMAALSAVGRVASRHPSALEPSVERLTALFDDDRRELRAGAAMVLADVTSHCPAVVAPLTERVVTLLADAETDAVRGPATAVLAGLARTRPERVRDARAVDPLVGALSADETDTRSNAAWILGRIGARDARDVLAARRQDDPAAEVREAASWALDRLEESAE
ncbi:MAG: HEAT repeat domain-containing protein, partial [Haloferacaceae archaeon]